MAAVPFSTIRGRNVCCRRRSELSRHAILRTMPSRGGTLPCLLCSFCSCSGVGAARFLLQTCRSLRGMLTFRTPSLKSPRQVPFEPAPAFASLLQQGQGISPRGAACHRPCPTL